MNLTQPLLEALASHLFLFAVLTMGVAIGVTAFIAWIIRNIKL